MVTAQKTDQLAGLQSITQVADLLGVDRNRIVRLVKKRKIVTQRAGWVHLIPDSQIAVIREKLGLSSEDPTS